MYQDKYELNVSVNGKPVREFYKDGKYFIEARNGSEYSIKLKNHSHKKIMAVFSIDGVDVLKGGKASEAQSGYIINPYSHVVINGYRIDDNNVATFKFDDGKNSYATQVDYNFDAKKIEKVKKGQLAASKNNGVIGVRIWEEKEAKFIKRWKTEQVTYTYPTGNFNSFSAMYSGYAPNVITGSFPMGIKDGNSKLISATYSRSASLPATFNTCTTLSSFQVADSVDYSNSITSVGISNPVPQFNFGTTWGEQITDKVLKVDFEKADSYVDLTLYYVERAELIKIGIDLENTKQVFVSGWPKAFEEESYCKQPVDWRKS